MCSLWQRLFVAEGSDIEYCTLPADLAVLLKLPVRGFQNIHSADSLCLSYGPLSTLVSWSLACAALLMDVAVVEESLEASPE
jgi:hypothetical protein